VADNRRGARRSEAARTAILDATARQFTERGWEQLSIEAIAADAGVGKQTIYRWWSSKSALVAECLLEGLVLPHSFTPHDTGDLRGDLVTWLNDIFTFIAEPRSADLLRSLLAAATTDERVGARLREALGGISPLNQLFDAAIAAGKLPADAPIQEIGEALVGAVIVRVISRAPLEPNLAERLVAAVLGKRTHPK
jgi:AcrR family transcriptional regulator